MGPISLTTTVDAPRERVFDLICDLSARLAWTDHFIRDYRLERIPAAGQGAAARFRVDAPGGIRYMETVIAEADRPHRIVEHGRGGRLDRIPIRAVWELKGGSAGPTTLVLTFWTEPSEAIDRLRGLRGGRWWRRRWSRALRRLREQVESGAEPAERAEVAGASL
jgi:uncharacterized protein YndB with AHSA1/START domain